MIPSRRLYPLKYKFRENSKKSKRLRMWDIYCSNTPPSSWRMRIKNAQLVLQILELLLTESFGEDVCKLFGGGSVARLDDTRHDMVPNKVAIDFNMFGTFMKNRIVSNMNGGLVVTMQACKRRLKAQEMEQVSCPDNFAGGISHGSIFGLDKGPSDCRLLLRFPGDRGRA